MWEFTSPRTIAFGEEALEYLGDIEGERVFIVCGKSVEKLGILKRVADVLKQAGLDVEVFNEVEPEPSIATVVNGSRKMASFGPDWIVAVGGGSSMDAAKAMWVLYERPDLAVEMINPFEKLGLRKKAKLICIPTTSGSGSEATWATVVTDAQLALKMELASRELVPDIVILDPRMPASMSPRLTAQSGLDVLAHAIETYVSDYRNDFSEALALRAIQLVFRYLPEVYKNGESIEARSKMHSAATMAGLAFGNAQLSISHSMGHSFGAVFKVPHGRSVGLFLPLSIEFSSPVVKHIYADIAASIGIQFSNEEEAVEKLVVAIKNMKTLLQEPNTVRDAGIDDEEYNSRLDDLVERAMLSAMTAMCPRRPTAAEYEKLFICAYNGDPVDF